MRKNAVDFSSRWQETFFTGLLLTVVMFPVCIHASDVSTQTELNATMATQSLLDALKNYQFGEKQDVLDALSTQVIASQHDPGLKAELLSLFCSFLETDASLPAKQFVCRQLLLIGMKDAVPVLGKLLVNPETSDMARYVLERMPDPSATEALLTALEQTQGKSCIGIINSLGERRDNKAVKHLVPLLKETDPALTCPVMLALGKIGTREAAEALLRRKMTAAQGLQPVVNHALLLCADNLSKKGDLQRAGYIYTLLYEPSEMAATRAGALTGLAQVYGIEALPALINALNSIDEPVRFAAACALRNLPEASKSVADSLSTLNNDALVLALGALVDIGSTYAAPKVLPFLTSDDSEIRALAFDVLAKWGQTEHVVPLLRFLAQSDATVAKAKRKQLASLSDPAIDDVIATVLMDTDANMRREAINALAIRYAYPFAANVLKCATDENPDVRTEALRAMGVLARPEDVPAILDLLLREKDPTEASLIADVVTGVAQKDASGLVCDQVASFLNKTGENVVARCAAISMLGNIASDKYLPLLRKCYKERTPEVKEAALRAIAGWPSINALDDLEKMSRRAPNETLRTVALRGYIRLLSLPSERSTSKNISLYLKAWQRSKGLDEKRAVITGLSCIEAPETLAALERLKQEPELENDIRKARESVITKLMEVSASVNGEQADLAADGNPATSWSSGQSQRSGTWFAIDFGTELKLNSVTLVAPDAKSFPRSFDAFITKKGGKEERIIADAQGLAEETKIDLSGVACCGIRVQLNAADTSPWKISEVQIEVK